MVGKGDIPSRHPPHDEQEGGGPQRRRRSGLRRMKQSGWGSEVAARESQLEG